MAFVAFSIHASETNCVPNTPSTNCSPSAKKLPVGPPEVKGFVIPEEARYVRRVTENIGDKPNPLYENFSFNKSYGPNHDYVSDRVMYHIVRSEDGRTSFGPFIQRTDPLHDPLVKPNRLIGLCFSKDYWQILPEVIRSHPYWGLAFLFERILSQSPGSNRGPPLYESGALPTELLWRTRANVRDWTGDLAIRLHLSLRED